MAMMMKYCFGVVVAMVLMGTFANAAVTVHNDLARNITIKNLPGCCNNCTVGKPCPRICRPCLPVVVGPNKDVTLDIGVGPFPLYGLEVEFKGKDYCPDRNDISLLTNKGTLHVGAGPKCDQDPPSLNAFILDVNFGQIIVQPTCLTQCNGGGILLVE